MVFKAIITVLCGVGLYASVFMLIKTRRAQRGELAEPSVVQSPRARLYGGLPNALLGALYYPALAVTLWFAPLPEAAGIAVLAAVALAGATSAVLAWSLLFVTRRACPYCWTAHLVNWSLALLCLDLLRANVLFSTG
ncbi:MAG TPA: vitamin K epoxide reductase family protein [Candidatus Tumulicola sp.]|jgi:uncharacterized membrane protein